MRPPVPFGGAKLGVRKYRNLLGQLLLTRFAISLVGNC